MPLTPTYPGVYIEEVPSTVRTINGVATSITAFVGRARRGPIDRPRRITTWGDFERIYGGLWTKSTMSYAVQQYFLNGGADAVIARVVHEADVGAGEVEARAAALGSATGAETWTFQASTAGPDGNDLTVRATVATGHPNDVAYFDLSISDGVNPTILVEDVHVTELSDGDALGAGGLVTVVGPIPSIRPTLGADVSLAEGAAPAAASVDLGSGVVLRAAIAGRLGNGLRATVSDPTGATPSGEYDLLVELLDEDGDVLASARYQDLVPNAAWPVPTLTGTTVPLIDTTANTPAARPINVDRAEFTQGSDAEKASGSIGVTITGLPLVAASPGVWGNHLQAAFDHATSDTTDASLFNVFVREVDDDGQEVRRETFRNVSLDEDSPRYVKKVIEETSELVVLTGAGWPRPPATPVVDGEFEWMSFTNGSDGEDIVNTDFAGSEDDKQGIYLLEKTDLFNLMVIPPPTRDADVDPAVWIDAMAYCKRRRALLLVDPPSAWTTKDDVVDGLGGLGLQGTDSTNAAMYWPYIRAADPLREYRLEAFPPAGSIAGLMARNDAQRGVWTAPAGTDASVTGARALVASITDREHGQINPLGVNVIRSFPVIGTVVWGARTLRGADVLASEWNYVPVRRLALMIEESLFRGTQWAVFQGNDERLWSQLRLNVRAFMHNLFRQGAFQGSSPRDAYLVKCDGETTTQSDIDRGIVNVLVGFRPLKPAEFVFLKISQLAGQDAA